MENKYYAPDISEFHVGFIYYNEKDNTTGESDGTDIESFCFLGIPDYIKVKYLDRDDIEELGWEKGGWRGDLERTPFVEFQRKIRDSAKDSGTTLIWRWDGFGNNITIGRLTGKAIVFSGNVRNKCELKKLMSMLDIPVKQ